MQKISKQRLKGKDEIIKKRYLDAVKKTVDSERRKSIAKINEENHMRLIRAKDNVFKHAFTEAQKILLSVRSQANYENIFRKLLKKLSLNWKEKKSCCTSINGTRTSAKNCWRNLH